MENLDPPSPPKSRMGKWRVFALRAASSLIWGGWGLLFHFILSKIAILDKINGKPRPPSPPNQGWENGAFLPFARLHPWFGGDGGLLFHFILSKIVARYIVCCKYYWYDIMAACRRGFNSQKNRKNNQWSNTGKITDSHFWIFKEYP